MLAGRCGQCFRVIPSESLSTDTDLLSQFTDYAHTITPHLLSYPDPPSEYMQTLLHRLQKFNLTKPEVLMMINLGVGLQRKPDPRHDTNSAERGAIVDTVENGDVDLLAKVEQHINSSERGEAQANEDGQNDIEMQDEQQDASDASVLSTIVEEMYERFDDDDINEILNICGEVLGGNERNANDIRAELGDN